MKIFDIDYKLVSKEGEYTFTGFGITYYNNGYIDYIGEFINGMYSGKCKIYYKNG